MQAIIDPYARADVFISFGEEGVNVEEGYLTFTSLPAGLLMKVGKMRAEFGKVNTIHNHALSYIDRPLATNNLVGGEDGIDDAGISIQRFLPAPKNWFAQGTAQIFRGDSGELFSSNRRQDVSVVGHLRAYRDLSESTNANLTDTGFSGILTYWPSEFSQVRTQYRYGHLWDDPNQRYTNANELLFQFLFVMGAHGAHPF